MKSRLKMYVLLLLALTSPFTLTADDQRKDQMKAQIDVIHTMFYSKYGPAEWKEQYTGWKIEDEAQIAKDKIDAIEDITHQDFRKITNQLINGTKDYHVSVLYTSTEGAKLPFAITSAEGRYFVTWVDTRSEEIKNSSMEVGDEILEFDGVAIDTAVSNFLEDNYAAPFTKTDHSLACMMLLSRSGLRGHEVPQGSVKLVLTSKAEGKYTCSLQWEYTPEDIFLKGKDDFCKKEIDLDTLKKMSRKDLKKHLFGTMETHLTSKIGKLPNNKKVSGGNPLGTRETFVPVLGNIVEKWKNEATPYPAYIYKNENGSRIGYLRSPNYTVTTDSSYIPGEIEDIIDWLEEETDALVIDQVNNPGGYVHEVYDLVHHLTNTPLLTPKHQIAMTPDDIWTSTQQYLPLIEQEINHVQEGVEWLQKHFTNSELNSFIENDITVWRLVGYSKEEFLAFQELIHTIYNKPNDICILEEGEVQALHEYHYNEMLEVLPLYIRMKEYFTSLVTQWKEGKTLTSPMYLMGQKYIESSEKGYTKPILILINELDFSGGDFFPAIMQDNERAKIFGVSTAGAGGFVGSYRYPNQSGILAIQMTGSIAYRLDDKQPLENLGVSPDYQYDITADDIHNGYEGYKNAVNEKVRSLLK